MLRVLFASSRFIRIDGISTERTENERLSSPAELVLVFVLFVFLHPPPSLSQERHSGLVMRMTLLSDRHAVQRRSSTLMSPRVCACRMAFLAVVRETPATAAIRSMNQVQAFRPL